MDFTCCLFLLESSLYETWIQKDEEFLVGRSFINWSNCRLSSIHSSHWLPVAISACAEPVEVGMRMSAASPVLCWLFGAPPTRALSLGQRKPELMWIGTLKCWRRGSRTFSQRARVLCEFVTTTAVADELAFLGESMKEMLGVDVGGERLDGAVEVALGENGVRNILTNKYNNLSHREMMFGLTKMAGNYPRTTFDLVIRR